MRIAATGKPSKVLVLKPRQQKCGSPPSASVQTVSFGVFVGACVGTKWLVGHSSWGVGLQRVEMLHSSIARFLNHQTDVPQSHMLITYQGQGRACTAKHTHTHTKGLSWPHIRHNEPQGHMNAIKVYLCTAVTHTHQAGGLEPRNSFILTDTPTSSWL